MAVATARERLDERGRWLALRLVAAVAVVVPLWAVADLLREGLDVTVHFLGWRLVCTAVLLLALVAIHRRRGHPGVVAALAFVVVQVDAGWMVPQTAHPEASVLGSTLVLYACGAVLVVGWGWTVLLGVSPVAGAAVAWSVSGASLTHDQVVICAGTMLTATVTAALAHAVRHRGLLREVQLATDLEAEQARTRRMAEQMEMLSATDPLTGLANRRAWDAALADLGTGPAAVLLVDVDHFKAVNDTGGHPAGDRVLRQVARSLLQSVRAEDLVARIGGDEFAVLLRGVPQGSAAVVGEVVRARVADMPGLPVTLSVGVAVDPGPDVDVEALVRAADAYLYRAKVTRNAVVGAATS